MEDYSALLEHAISLGGERRYREAANTLLRLLSKTDKYSEAYLYLGRSFHALGEYAKAVDALRHFIHLNPSSAAGYFFTGRSYLSAGRARTASDYLEKAVQLRPDFISALQLLGYAYLKSGAIEKSVKVLSGAVEMDKQNQRLFSGYLNSLFVHALKQFRLGNYRYAGQLFNYLLQHGREHILIYIHLGMIYRMDGEVEAAVDAYRKALRFAPEDELLRFRLATLLLENGHTAEAFEHLDRISTIPQARILAQREADRYLAEHFYDTANYTQALHHALQAVKRNPRDIQMRLVAGECYRELEEFEFASNHFQRVLDIDRRHLGAHFGIAQVMWQQQSFEEMANRLHRIKRLDPGNEYARYYLLLCGWKLEEEPDRLLDELHRGIEELGKDAYLYTALGDTYLRLSEAEKGRTAFHKAVEIAPTLSFPYARLIDLHRSGTPVEGIENIYEHYLDLQPKDRRTRGAFVHHLFRREQYRTVLEQLELLLPDTEHLHYYTRIKAVCLRRIGDYTAASALYWRMLAEEPEKQEYLRALAFCLSKEGKRETATTLLHRALQYLSNPDSELYLIYGVMLYRDSEYEGALEAFREASTLRPEDWRPHYNIGEIYRRKGMKDFARRFLDRAERLKSGMTSEKG